MKRKYLRAANHIANIKITLRAVRLRRPKWVELSDRFCDTLCQRHHRLFIQTKVKPSRAAFLSSDKFREWKNCRCKRSESELDYAGWERRGQNNPFSLKNKNSWLRRFKVRIKKLGWIQTNIKFMNVHFLDRNVFSLRVRNMILPLSKRGKTK